MIMFSFLLFPHAFYFLFCSLTCISQNHPHVRRPLRCKEGEEKVGNDCNTIDECLSNPCKNGGKCVDHMNRFTCVCTPGWKGTFCEIEQRPVRKPPLKFSVGAIIAILVCLLLILSKYRTDECLMAFGIPSYIPISYIFTYFIHFVCFPTFSTLLVLIGVFMVFLIFCLSKVTLINNYLPGRNHKLSDHILSGCKNLFTSIKFFILLILKCENTLELLKSLWW